MELPAGSTFGPYRILGPLGRGGMASVYRARDSALERDVALKVLPAEFLHDAAFADRFRQEARVAGRLEHPHIVPVHAFGIEQGAPWMAMRLVTGGSLAERVRGGPMAPRVVAALLRDVAGALDYAHERGIVHRDVKPANVLLDEAARGYLADFGVARMLEGSSVVTTTGMIQGTPSYMAPEQAMGETVAPARAGPHTDSRGGAAGSGRGPAGRGTAGGGESVELTGQDSMTGFNTWSGAAGGAAKQVETWLAHRLGSPGRP